MGLIAGVLGCGAGLVHEALDPGIELQDDVLEAAVD